jgi:hypothetical protein
MSPAMQRHRERRAAHLGISVAELDARIAAEQARLDAINALINSRDLMRQVIARRALEAGRSFRIAEAAL